MNKLILIISIVFFAFACDSDEEINKDNIIDKKKMARILIEIHIAEGKVNEVKLPMDTALSYYKYLEGNIYDKYEIDSAMFNQSMHYYSENIRELDKIYETVLDSLNLRSAKQDEVEED